MKISLSRFLGRLTGALPRASLAALTILIASFAWAHPALAQVSIDAVNMGDLFCNMSIEMNWFPDLFGAIAYIAGVAFIGQALYLLVKYYDNPASVPISQPLTRMGGGAALLAAPSVASAVIITLFGVDSGGGLAACVPGPVTVAGPGVLDGLDVLLNNLIGNIKDPLTFLISVIAVVIGVFMIVNGLIKASRYGTDPREYSMTKILSNLVVGAILVVVGQTFGTMLESIFGVGAVNPSSDVIGWNFIVNLGVAPGSQFVLAIKSAGLFIELIGMIAFVRGWLILKSASEGSGQATMAQGLTHVIGGVLAMNIFGFLELMDATFGTNFL